MAKVRSISFPKDDPKKPCHLTATMGYKAGAYTVVVSPWSPINFAIVNCISFPRHAS